MESGEPNIGLRSSSAFFRTRKKLRKRRKTNGTMTSGMIHEKNIEKYSRKASKVSMRPKRGRKRQVLEDCSLNSFLDWCQKRLSKESFAEEEEFTIGGNGIRPFPRKENNKSLERNLSKNNFPRPNYHSSSRRKTSPSYLVPMPRGSKIKLEKDRANSQLKRYPPYFEEEIGRTVTEERKISSKQYEAHLLFPKLKKEREINGSGKKVNFAKCKLYLTPRKPSGPLRLYLEPVKGYNTLFLKAEIPFTKEKDERRGGGLWDVLFKFLKTPFSRGTSQSPH